MELVTKPQTIKKIPQEPDAWAFRIRVFHNPTVVSAWCPARFQPPALHTLFIGWMWSWVKLAPPIHAHKLRAYSAQFERIEESLSDPRARHIHRASAIHADEDPNASPIPKGLHNSAQGCDEGARSRCEPL